MAEAAGEDIPIGTPTPAEHLVQTSAGDGSAETSTPGEQAVVQKAERRGQLGSVSVSEARAAVAQDSQKVFEEDVRRIMKEMAVWIAKEERAASSKAGLVDESEASDRPASRDVIALPFHQEEVHTLYEKTPSGKREVPTSLAEDLWLLPTSQTAVSTKMESQLIKSTTQSDGTAETSGSSTCEYKLVKTLPESKDSKNGKQLIKANAQPVYITGITQPSNEHESPSTGSAQVLASNAVGATIKQLFVSPSALRAATRGADILHMSVSSSLTASDSLCIRTGDIGVDGGVQDYISKETTVEAKAADPRATSSTTTEKLVRITDLTSSEINKDERSSSSQNTPSGLTMKTAIATEQVSTESEHQPSSFNERKLDTEAENVKNADVSPKQDQQETTKKVKSSKKTVREGVSDTQSEETNKTQSSPPGTDDSSKAKAGVLKTDKKQTKSQKSTARKDNKVAASSKPEEAAVDFAEKTDATEKQSTLKTVEEKSATEKLDRKVQRSPRMSNRKVVGKHVTATVRKNDKTDTVPDVSNKTMEPVTNIGSDLKAGKNIITEPTAQKLDVVEAKASYGKSISNQKSDKEKAKETSISKGRAITATKARNERLAQIEKKGVPLSNTEAKGSDNISNKTLNVPLKKVRDSVTLQRAGLQAGSAKASLPGGINENDAVGNQKNASTKEFNSLSTGSKKAQLTKALPNVKRDNKVTKNPPEKQEISMEAEKPLEKKTPESTRKKGPRVSRVDQDTSGAKRTGKATEKTALVAGTEEICEQPKSQSEMGKALLTTPENVTEPAKKIKNVANQSKRPEESSAAIDTPIDAVTASTDKKSVTVETENTGVKQETSSNRKHKVSTIKTIRASEETTQRVETAKTNTIASSETIVSSRDKGTTIKKTTTNMEHTSESETTVSATADHKAAKAKNVPLKTPNIAEPQILDTTASTTASADTISIDHRPSSGKNTASSMKKGSLKKGISVQEDNQDNMKQKVIADGACEVQPKEGTNENAPVDRPLSERNPSEETTKQPQTVEQESLSPRRIKAPTKPADVSTVPLAENIKPKQKESSGECTAESKTGSAQSEVKTLTDGLAYSIAHRAVLSVIPSIRKGSTNQPLSRLKKSNSCITLDTKSGDPKSDKNGACDSSADSQATSTKTGNPGNREAKEKLTKTTTASRKPKTLELKKSESLTALTSLKQQLLEENEVISVAKEVSRQKAKTAKAIKKDKPAADALAVVLQTESGQHLSSSSKEVKAVEQTVSQNITETKRKTETVIKAENKQPPATQVKEQDTNKYSENKPTERSCTESNESEKSPHSRKGSRNSKMEESVRTEKSQAVTELKAQQEKNFEFANAVDSSPERQQRGQSPSKPKQVKTRNEPKATAVSDYSDAGDSSSKLPAKATAEKTTKLIKEKETERVPKQERKEKAQNISMLETKTPETTDKESSPERLKRGSKKTENPKTGRGPEMTASNIKDSTNVTGESKLTSQTESTGEEKPAKKYKTNPRENTEQTSGEQVAASKTSRLAGGVESPRKHCGDLKITTEKDGKVGSVSGTTEKEQTPRERIPEAAKMGGDHRSAAVPAHQGTTGKSTEVVSPRKLAKKLSSSPTKSVKDTEGSPDLVRKRTSFDFRVEIEEEIRAEEEKLKKVKATEIGAVKAKKAQKSVGTQNKLAADTNLAVSSSSKETSGTNEWEKSVQKITEKLGLLSRIAKQPLPKTEIYTKKESHGVDFSSSTVTKSNMLKSDKIAVAEKQKRRVEIRQGGHSPENLIAQLKAFMAHASQLNKLGIKSKVKESIGVPKVEEALKRPMDNRKSEVSRKSVTKQLEKVVSALIPVKETSEDSPTRKVLNKDHRETVRWSETKTTRKRHGTATTDRSEFLAKSVVKEDKVKVASRTEGKKRYSASRKYKGIDIKSTTGSSCLSSESSTLRPILVKDRARRRKTHMDRRAKTQVRFNEQTGLSSAESRGYHDSRSPSVVSPREGARRVLVPPVRRREGKLPLGIVSSTLLARKRIRPSRGEKKPATTPSAPRGSTKILPAAAAAAAMIAVTLKARGLGKERGYAKATPPDSHRRSPRVDKTDEKRHPAQKTTKTKQRSPRKPDDIIIRGLTAAGGIAPTMGREENQVPCPDYSPPRIDRKQREKLAHRHDHTPVIPQVFSDIAKSESPRKVYERPQELSIPTWHSVADTVVSKQKSGKEADSLKHSEFKTMREKQKTIGSRTPRLDKTSFTKPSPNTAALSKTLSVPTTPAKQRQRELQPSRKKRIEDSYKDIVDVDIRLGNSIKSRPTNLGTEECEATIGKSASLKRDLSIGDTNVEVLNVHIKSQPAIKDESLTDMEIKPAEGEVGQSSIETLLPAKSRPDAGDVGDQMRNKVSSESLLGLSASKIETDRKVTDQNDGEGDDEESDLDSDSSSKTWPRASHVTPTTKMMDVSVASFSTSSVPEETKSTTSTMERCLSSVVRKLEARPLECDLRWSAWMAALHAGDPDAAADPFPSALSRKGRRDVDAALTAAGRVPALWLLARVTGAELGARAVRLLHWLLVRLPAVAPSLMAVCPQDVHRSLRCPCRPCAAFKVCQPAGSALDARLRWRARGLPQLEAWASPPPSQLHALVCGGAATPVGVLSLSLPSALRRAPPGYGCGASRLGARLRCVLKCEVAQHPELVERVGADSLVVRGPDLVRVRQLLVFREPLPEGALSAWALAACKRRRLAVACGSLLATYLLVAVIVWLVGVAPESPPLPEWSWPWAEEQKPAPYSFWA